MRTFIKEMVEERKRDGVRDQIFAWTGNSPASHSKYAPYLQVFRQGDNFTVVMRSTDGVLQSVAADGKMISDLVMALIPAISNFK